MTVDERLEEAGFIIDNFINTLSNIAIQPSFSLIVDSILECKGKVGTTGMGKAGLAMRKFSSTLCAFGIPSFYIHPGEASHGDLGCISPEDILFVASTSGKTREVLEIIELSRQINVKRIIGITSHPDSLIRDKVDLVMDMGVIVEAGHLGLAPTSSILVMQALTDCLASVVAKEKNVTLAQYGLRHHSGYLGSKARQDGRIY